MKEYKVQQHVYNRLNEHTDLIGEEDIILLEDYNSIIQYGTAYFLRELPELVYPAKSFSVAIIYAFLIEKHFGTPFLQSLNDPDLLCGNDMYFKIYDEAFELYDAILNGIDFINPDFALNENISQVAKTIEFFNLEFNLTASR